MAVVIRMKRTGRRNRPCYRISVMDRAFPRDGRTLDNLGVYDPASPKEDLRLKLDVERAKHWVSQGAIPSETVRSIFRREGVLADAPQRKPRKRPGRKVVTAAGKARVAAKSARAERKSGRRAERLKARAEAARAAKAAEGQEG